MNLNYFRTPPLIGGAFENEYALVFSVDDDGGLIQWAAPRGIDPPRWTMSLFRLPHGKRSIAVSAVCGGANPRDVFSVSADRELLHACYADPGSGIQWLGWENLTRGDHTLLPDGPIAAVAGLSGSLAVLTVSEGALWQKYYDNTATVPAWRQWREIDLKEQLDGATLTGPVAAIRIDADVMLVALLCSDRTLRVANIGISTGVPTLVNLGPSPNRGDPFASLAIGCAPLSHPFRWHLWALTEGGRCCWTWSDAPWTGAWGDWVELGITSKGGGLSTLPTALGCCSVVGIYAIGLFGVTPEGLVLQRLHFDPHDAPDRVWSALAYSAASTHG